MKTIISGLRDMLTRLGFITSTSMKSHKLQFDQMFSFATDSAGMTIFDPALLQERVNEEDVWFADDFDQLNEVVRGECAMIGLGSDGVYKIRLTQGELSEKEQAFAKYRVNLGLKVASEYCLVGALEILPFSGSNPTLTSIDEMHGGFLAIANGEYDLHIYGLDLELLDEAPSEENKTLKETLPDIVVVIHNRTENFNLKTKELEMFTDYDKRYLFESALRKKIVKLQKNKNLQGIHIKAKVFKDSSNELSLREHESNWPRGYKVELEDYAQIEWQDRLLLEITAVDKKAKILKAKVIERRKKGESFDG